MAAAGNPIINDCESNGQLTHQYTPAQLHHALAIMPASVKQYTNCYDVIQLAIVKSKSTRQGNPSTSSSGSFLPTPVIVILVLLILAAVTFGAIAIRRRRTATDGGPDAGGPPSGDLSP